MHIFKLEIQLMQVIVFAQIQQICNMDFCNLIYLNTITSMIPALVDIVYMIVLRGIIFYPGLPGYFNYIVIILFAVTYVHTGY